MTPHTSTPSSRPAPGRWSRALVLFAAGALPLGWAAHAHASIAMNGCMQDERLPDRVKNASLIVIATPKTIAFVDNGGERTITARYEIAKTLKGKKKAGETITIVATCGLVRSWSDDRGYPSNFCGRDQNQVLPGFAGAKALDKAQRTLILQENAGALSLLKENMYGACPAVNIPELAKKDAALRGVLDARASSPEWNAETPLPYTDPQAGKQLDAAGYTPPTTLFFSKTDAKMSTLSVKDTDLVSAQAKGGKKVMLLSYAESDAKAVKALAEERMKVVTKRLVDKGVDPKAITARVEISTELAARVTLDVQP